MVRKARAKDLLKIESLLSRFYSSENFPDCNVPYSRDSVLNLILQMILSKNHIILVNDKNGEIGGVIGGGNVFYPLNSNYFFLGEIFWYSEDKSGMKLLNEFEKIGKNIGANATVIVNLSKYRDEERLRGILGKRGYKVVENSLHKEL